MEILEPWECCLQSSDRGVVLQVPDFPSCKSSATTSCRANRQFSNSVLVQDAFGRNTISTIAMGLARHKHKTARRYVDVKSHQNSDPDIDTSDHQVASACCQGCSHPKQDSATKGTHSSLLFICNDFPVPLQAVLRLESGEALIFSGHPNVEI